MNYTGRRPPVYRTFPDQKKVEIYQKVVNELKKTLNDDEIIEPFDLQVYLNSGMIRERKENFDEAFLKVAHELDQNIDKRVIQRWKKKLTDWTPRVMEAKFKLFEEEFYEKKEPKPKRTRRKRKAKTSNEEEEKEEEEKLKQMELVPDDIVFEIPAPGNWTSDMEETFDFVLKKLKE